MANAADDLDCAEYWDIPCPEPEYTCFEKVVNASCAFSDLDCYVGFLRAMCGKYDIEECNEDIMIAALKKTDGCVAGVQGCIGFQTMFGGPVSIECKPWDLHCTLIDQFGEPFNLSDERKKLPLLRGMPGTSLTIEEN